MELYGEIRRKLWYEEEDDNYDMDDLWSLLGCELFHIAVVSFQSLIEGSIGIIRDIILFAMLLDKFSDLGIPCMRDIREQMMFDLIVKSSTNMGHYMISYLFSVDWKVGWIYDL